MREPREVVSRYLEAVSEGRLDEVGPLLDPGVALRGPGGVREGAEAWVDLLRDRVLPITARLRVERLFGEGEHVCAVFTLIGKSGGEVSYIEAFVVREGLITAADLAFDGAALKALIEDAS